jgi:hypothetical protein
MLWISISNEMAIDAGPSVFEMVELRWRKALGVVSYHGMLREVFYSIFR